eukprot:g4815.t1
MSELTSGSMAPIERFPYMCSLKRPSDGVHFCVGTLIKQKWILTAAHCVDSDFNESSVAYPLVYCGVHNSTDRDETKRFPVHVTHFHPLWTGELADGHDIALIEITKRATFDIPAVVAPRHNHQSRQELGTVGWSRTNGGGVLYSEGLQVITGLSLTSQEICNSNTNWNGIITESMICAQSGDSEFCTGNSGSPLIELDYFGSDLSLGNPASDLVIGVESFGDGNCNNSVPTVYTDLTCFANWISCVTEKEGDCHYVDTCPEEVKGSEQSIEAIELCLDVIAEDDFNDTNALRSITTAFENDSAETVERILCQGLDVNIVYGDLNTSLLIEAARRDAVKSAKVLLRHGAELEYEDALEETALSKAAVHGSENTLKFLIEQGANLESKDNHGLTPLAEAVWHRKINIVEILLMAGANTEAKSDSGRTPLHYSASRRTNRSCELLIEYGAEVDAVDDREYTPLMVAAEHGSTPVLQILLEANADANAAGDEGMTSLHLASQEDFVDIVEALLAAGANVSMITDDGLTPLHIAARYNQPEVIQVLLDAGAYIEARTKAGDTPLMVAAHYGSLSVVELLIAEGALVNATDDNAFTALHLASLRGHVEVVESLLENGALNVEDGDGNTPYDLICRSTRLEKPCTNETRAELVALLED